MADHQNRARNASHAQRPAGRPFPLRVVSRCAPRRFVLPKLEIVEVLVGMFVIMGAGVLFLG